MEERCPCGKIDKIENMQLSDDCIPTCNDCATELKIEYVADQAANNQNLN